MNPAILWPASTPLSGSVVSLSVANPPMSYDSTRGTPTPSAAPQAGQQTIVPPFTNLDALLYEINAAGPIYCWNKNTATWNAI